MQKQRQQGLGMKELWVGESWNSSYFPQKYRKHEQRERRD